MNIYLDIETIPAQDENVKRQLMENVSAPANYKDPEKIAQYKRDNAEQEWLKTGLDGALGQICSIAVAIDESEPVAFFKHDYQNGEKSILVDFFSYLDSHVLRQLSQNVTSTAPVIFIGHNIVEFDLRFIFQRCVVLGIKPPRYIPFNAKVWDGNIFDTMTQWAGIKGRVALDKLSGVLGAPTKGDIDGSKVWEYVSSGRIEEVAEYNKADVIRTRIVHKRLTFSDAA